MSAREENVTQRRPPAIEYDRFGFNRHFEPTFNSDNGHRFSADSRTAFESSPKPNTR